MPVGLYRTAPDGTILDGNPFLARLFGHASMATLRGTNAAALHEDPLQRRAFLGRLAARPGVAVEQELALRRADGSPLWVRDIACGHPGAGGDLEFIEGALVDVTPQRLALEEAQRGREAERDVTENANDIIYSHDLEGRLLGANGAAARAFGIPRESLVGRHLEDLLDPGHVATARAMMAAKVAGETERTGPYELLARTGTGAPMWLEVSSRIVVVDGRPHHVQGMARDITRRKAAEGQLAEVAARLKAIMESAQDAIITADAEGRIVQCNPSATRLLGWSAAEMLGQELTLIIPPALRADHKAAFERFLATREPRIMGRPVELTALRNDGTTLPVELSLTSWEAGGRLHFTGMMRDISRRREAQEKARALFEDAPVGLIRASRGGELTEANPTAMRLLGADRFWLAGRRIADLFADPDAAREHELALDQVGEAAFEARWLRRDGTTVWVRGKTRAVRDAQGRTLHLEGHVEDVTAERQAQAGLDLLRTMAVRLSGAEDFTAALRIALTRIAEAAGWSFAEAWVPDRTGRVLVQSEAGHTTHGGGQKLRGLGRHMEFARGEGLLGRVWQEPETVWQPDLAREPGFHRNAAALAAGLRNLVLVPVRDRGALVAQLLFLSPASTPSDRHWVAVAESVADQLGSVLARRLAEDRLRRSLLLVQAQVEAANDGVLVVGQDGELLAANAQLLRMCGAKVRPSSQLSDPPVERVEDPHGLLPRIRLLYEMPADRSDCIRFEGRTYRRSSSPLWDQDSLLAGKVWSFREVERREG